MTGNARVGVVLPSAGKGTRMQNSVPKPLLPLLGKPILAHTVDRFQRSDAVDVIVIAAGEGDVELVDAALAPFHFTKVAAIIPGGKERQDSVWNGLRELSHHAVDVVLIHDAVRPFLRSGLIDRVIRAAVEEDGAIVAVKVKDTVKESVDGTYVRGTLDRTHLWLAQTPQAFSFSTIVRAYEHAQKEGYQATDDAALFEKIGLKVRIVEGFYENIKITTPEDMIVAEAICRTFVPGS